MTRTSIDTQIDFLYNGSFFIIIRRIICTYRYLQGYENELSNYTLIFYFTDKLIPRSMSTSVYHFKMFPNVYEYDYVMNSENTQFSIAEIKLTSVWN